MQASPSSSAPLASIAARALSSQAFAQGNGRSSHADTNLMAMAAATAAGLAATAASGGIQRDFANKLLSCKDKIKGFSLRQTSQRER